ncbi:MAG: A24 family peptidase [Clostridia bacterium]
MRACIPYILMSILAIIFGQIVAHLNKKLPPVVSEEITYKEFFKTFKENFKIDIKYSMIFLVAFNMLIYFLGNIPYSYLYAVLIACLGIVFSVDYHYRLIPDEAHIIIVILAIINLVFNLNMWWSYILGGIIGGAIFWGLGLISLLILKKEGMGFGDVKLMASLGFLFGIKYILVIALVAFFLGAIVGGAILIFKKKDSDGYIPFGPFIVIATVIVLFVPADYIINIYITFCSWLGMKMSDIIYFVLEKLNIIKI